MTPDYRFLTPKTPSPEHALDRQWYVRVEGTSYGPYDDRTLWAYVQESRVTAHSEVSLRPDRGFRPARDWLEIAHWFHGAKAQTPLPQTYVTQTHASETLSVEPDIHPAPSTQMELKLLLIVANIRSGRLSLFTQTLMSLGQMRALTPSTWLVESQISSDDTKAVLGPALSSKDSLLILDASNVEFSSYNLGVDGDADGLSTHHAETTGRLFGG